MNLCGPRPFVLVTALACWASPAWAQERIDPIPSGPEAIVEALSPFRGNPDSSSVADLITDERNGAEFPSSDHDRVLAARLWKRSGQTGLAMRELRSVEPDGPSGDLAQYEAARILLESETGTAAGPDAYWRACSSRDERTRAEIAWDLLSVTTPEEREEWESLASGQATCAWLRTFWGIRARLMAISTNERLAIHFKRLSYARESYWIPRPRLTRGLAEFHGRPEGIAFDDRGLIYIRMGEPVHKEDCSDASPEADVLGECWAYERPPSYKVFNFAIAEGRADADYEINGRLGPSKKVVPGDPWFQMYVMNADIPEATKLALVRQGGGIATSSVRDVDGRAMDQVEVQRSAREVELAVRRFTSEALEAIPDVPAVESTVTMRFETLRFMAPSTNTWHVWVLAAARAGDLAPSSGEPNSDGTRNVGGRLAVERPEGGILITEIPARSVSSGVPPDAAVPLRGTFEATPGPLPLTVVVEDLNAPGTGAWIQDTINIPSIGGLPQVSDIAVAQAEGGTWTRDGETFLRVSPAHITNPDGSIHTYFEVYGVRPGTRYEVELRLAPVDVADRIWRLEPDDLGFRLQFAAEMPGAIGRHHLRLDLGDTEPGEYTLALRIQDEASGAYSLPALTDVFVAER